MTLDLYIHPCIHDPPYHHSPPLDKPLKIQIQGPLESIQKILPDTSWHTENFTTVFPQPAGPELARLTFRSLYPQENSGEAKGDLVVQDEYLAWTIEGCKPLE
jgi:hypothetical protein